MYCCVWAVHDHKFLDLWRAMESETINYEKLSSPCNNAKGEVRVQPCVWGDRWALLSLSLLLLSFWRWGSKFHSVCVFVFKEKLEICRHIICSRLAQTNCGDFCLVKWVLGLHGRGAEGFPESTIVVAKEVVSLWFNCGFLCFASWQRFSGRLLHVGK